MINFDIVYKKQLENDSIKLLGESQLRQLKLMICGKYQIYDYSHIFIYYQNNKITTNDNTKLKDIFKTKKAKIEITEKEKIKNNSDDSNDYTNQLYNSKNKCSCGGSPMYICEKCEEFLCNFCLKKKKHITHDKNIIKLKDYSMYIKKYLKEMANELDNKILNDEAYKFLKYWEYDKDKEIKTINNLYDFIKEQIEDIKQLQIDNIINLSEGNKYNELKLKIRNTLNDYTSFNIDAEVEEILEQKKVLIQNSQEVVAFYNNIKIELLKYTRIIKELQWFNQEFQKLIQNKFNLIKKRYLGNNFNSFINLNNTSSFNFYNSTLNQDYMSNDNENSNNNRVLSSNASIYSLNNNLCNSAFLINVKPAEKIAKKNKSRSQINNKLKLKVKTKTSVHLSPTKKENLSVISQDRNKEKEFEKLSQALLNTSVNKQEKKIYNYNSLNSSPYLNESKSKSKYNNLITSMSNKNSSNSYLLKLKDKRKILIFNLKTQLFKEKIYFDRGNFRKELSSDADVIQLNLNNNLYMLSGKDNNKFFYYNFSTNSILFITNTLYSHYYGVMLFCKKNNKIFLLGGNNQKNCEMSSPLNNTSNSSEKKIRKKWKSLPPLNEERQEFAAMVYNDDYLYVFFGFSHIKGVNLNSIERMDINTMEKFETVYVNENITLSSLGCAILNDDGDDGGILLLGGFDGEKYIETSLIFCPEQMKIKECDIIIPNISKHFQFLFHKETNFIKTENNLQVVFDMKNNVHVLTNHSYELFSEVE